MKIKINNEQVVTPSDEMTVSELLIWRNIPEGGTAVAINGKLIPKSGRDIQYIKDQDDIVIISAAYGG